MANGGKLLELCRCLVHPLCHDSNIHLPAKKTNTHKRQKQDNATLLTFQISRDNFQTKHGKGHEKHQILLLYCAFNILSRLVDLPSCRCPALPRHCHHRWLNDPTWLSTKRFIRVVSAIFASCIFKELVCFHAFFRKKQSYNYLHMLVSLRGQYTPFYYVLQDSSPLFVSPTGVLKGSHFFFQTLASCSFRLHWNSVQNSG